MAAVPVACSCSRPMIFAEAEAGIGAATAHRLWLRDLDLANEWRVVAGNWAVAEPPNGEPSQSQTQS